MYSLGLRGARDDELSAAFEFDGVKRPESKTYDKLVRLTLSEYTPDH